MQHDVTFERRRAPGKFDKLYRARCTCGWFDVDVILDALQGRAAAHDIEWEEIKPREGGKDGHETKLKIV